MKKFIIFLFFLSLGLSGHILKASHLAGGEIRWVCIEGTGKYIFYMDIYRECTGTSFSFTTQSLQILNSTMPAIAMKPDQTTYALYGGGNISPKGPSGCQKTCVNGGPGSDLGATQFFPFVSDPVALNGTPPSSGWVFYWEGFARPNSVENLVNSGSYGYGLRAIMYPFEGRNTSQCYDSSPDFEERPAILICKGYEFIFNHNASDTDLDSLVFRWAEPLDASASGSTFSPNPVIFKIGYSYDSPTPGPSINPNNQSVTLNPKTGEIKLAVYSGQDGWQYASCLQVDAYRSGVKIASVFRDIPFIFFECPLLPGTGLYNNPPTAKINGTPANNYSTEVFAGEKIQVPFQSTEFDTVYDDPNDPSTARAQFNALNPSGFLFSKDFKNSVDCEIAGIEPCATLTPAPKRNVRTGQLELTGQGGISTLFEWQTDCNHLPLNNKGASNAHTYNFVMKIYDDHCDIPGIIYPSISVTVKPFVPEIIQQGNLLSVKESDSYQWFYNDTLIPNSDTNVITMTGSGKYSVEVVKNGCPSSKISNNFFAVGEEELEIDSKMDITIFPNPFKKSLTIEFKGDLQGEAFNYILSDMEGKAVKTVLFVIDDQKIVLDIVEKISPGTYILKIFNNEKQMIKKLIRY